ncbi:CDP-diacylglycerol--glycerol-3-phosphate 3-phosphatidyltransferase [Dictyobacter vulcani]|uniref:CDP-diacylglycerol--glycerol-3-phosphate 3-phosphatidyltransferase n=1 Tax=Dictyobacter vulcani TaxID=2607529 RepID=A0A5J4KLM7_9CHLR|nr:CDP-diacylglycerol--glycerol-3-phosphate 3-phosphatidyltransferase [Dictyobacter vulcani]GER87141.1 CDP-diacylglycerol--glycerol-3-phosphate 3-phosphatidyltransferase [Dictyobacter vulcani]
MRNLPNILSISRLVATVVVFILVLVNQPWAFLLATIIFFLGSVTDYLDGYLARRFKVVSSLGVFLDLTADKVFVAAVLIALVQLNLVPAWVTFIILTRELMVSGLRSIAAAKGKVIPAGVWGKQKTFITLVALGALLLAKGLGAHMLSLFPPMLTFNSQTVNPAEILLLIADGLIIIATIWTIMSGVEYLIGGWPLLRSSEEAAK